MSVSAIVEQYVQAKGKVSSGLPDLDRTKRQPQVYYHREKVMECRGEFFNGVDKTDIHCALYHLDEDIKRNDAHLVENEKSEKVGIEKALIHWVMVDLQRVYVAERLHGHLEKDKAFNLAMEPFYELVEVIKPGRDLTKTRFYESAKLLIEKGAQSGYI